MSNKAVFEDVYERSIWGYKSGAGSVESYSKKYTDFMLKEIAGKRVIDLGCGDFRIGGLICHVADFYLGVEVVEGLWGEDELNKSATLINVDLSVPGNITKVFNEYGPFDIAIMRDVMMHWTDEEISVFVKEMKNLQWGKFYVINSHRWNRKPEKNELPRDPRGNRYTMSPIDHKHEVLSPLELSLVMYYPRKGCKEVSVAIKEGANDVK